MAVRRTYRCDLCGDGLSLDGQYGKQGFGLYWTGRAWEERPAAQVERHLCAPCISSIQALPPRCGQGYECDGGPTCGSDHK